MKRRALAAKAYYSGKMDELRKQAIERGAIPWKILRYRRIVNPSELPFPVAPDDYVTPASFEKHLKYIAKECRPISLTRLVEMIDNHEQIPEKIVAVTIDGGHMDQYLNAFPLLLRYRVPASFFIPTGFVESRSFFYDDRLALMLSILKEREQVLPNFPFLPAEIEEDINKASPEGLVTEEVMNTLIAGVRNAPSEVRIAVMGRLAEVVEEHGGLPDFEDFMRWDDIRHVLSMGFGVGSLGHFLASNPGWTDQQFREDTSRSLQQFAAQGVSALPVYSFPEFGLTAGRKTVLGELGFRYALNVGYFAEPRFQVDLAMLLARIPMSEQLSYSTELFACRLWEVEIGGARF